jgi:hypothetical protein
MRRALLRAALHIQRDARDQPASATARCAMTLIRLAR